ncbi:MAG: lipopolysaccharide biosynthesis protein [Treponema sp.]|nr:lipopolysaccharide biosynthesis protein [Treponema sp.]
MMNILFCGNHKVFDGILTCTLSILKRTQSKNIFNFYIFTMDVSYLNKDFTSITDKQIAFLEKIIKSYNNENTIIKIDITDLYEKELKNSKNENTSYSPYCMLRLFADIPQVMPDKLLYLDTDTLANKDITSLYEINIDDYEYAVARDHYGKILVYPNFMNSGVMLMNIKKIRQTGLLQKARKIAYEKKYLFPDQTAIKKSTTKRKMLSQRFNDQKFLYKNTVIRHFSKRLFWTPWPHTENIKQWHWAKMMAKFKYTCFQDILEDYIYYKRKFELGE